MSSQQERPDVVSSEMHLLLSRLQPPRLSSPLVKRERLLTLLDAACSHPLTLLLAPAGFGKTTLVAQWITDSSSIHEQKLPVSWLSLEESDNDPARFWHYVIAAIQNFHAEVSTPARLSGMFPTSFEQSFQDRVLTPLLNTLTLHACRGLLVLEDYHTITEPAIHKTLAFFLDHLPDSLHIVMLSRSEPPLPLARWRARGAVHEIQATDLRFSPKETATFFQQMLAFPLTEETLHRLDAQLEGWAAGLRLLTLTLQRRTTPPDVEQSLSLLTSTHRPILDYFISEVLSAQPEPLQRFLLQTSVLSRLNGSLCDAVTGRQDSSRLLEETERAGLFLRPLNVPGLWYRYHELFAEALRYTARHRLGEEALHTLLLRACQWYETHAMLDEAIETALAIHEYARAAPLIERSNAAQLSKGWHHTLHRWLAQMPEEILWARPKLCFMYAMAYLFVKDRFAPETRTFLEMLLQKAEQVWHSVDDQPKLGAAYTLRSLVAWWQDDYAGSFAAARQALALLPAQDIRLRGMSMLHVSMEEQFAGRFNAARQMLIEARARCAQANNVPPMITATLALGNLCFEQGALQQAEQYYRQALVEAEKEEDSLDDQGFARLGLAHLSYEWNDRASARQQAFDGLAHGRQLGNQVLQAHAVLVLARILHAQGDDEQAQRLLQESVAQIHRPGLLRALLLGQARLALVCGDLAAAQRWFPAGTHHETLIPFAQREQEMLFKARLLLAQKAYHEALTLLNGWQREEFSRGELEHLVLSALAHNQLASTEQPATMQSSNHRLQARQLLLRALKLAQPGAFQRLFLDEGEPLAILLRTVLPEISDAELHAYATALVLAFSDPVIAPGKSEPDSHPLSLQEQRILHLLAAGHSKSAIAQKLIVSLNTVKTHVKNIYRKLGATNRQEAIARARALRLLS